MLSLLVPQVHAKHAAVVLTALLVPPIVHILQLLVLLEPFPLVQQRVVHVPVVLIALRVRPVVFLLVLLEPIPVVRRACHAALASTTTKPVKRLVKVAMRKRENTNPKREKHRATIVLVPW